MLETRILFDRASCTFTYLVYDPLSKEALIIDPVIDHHDRDLLVIKELNLNLKYVFDTHIHADHITGARALKEVTGATYIMGKQNRVEGVDEILGEGSRISLGTHYLTAIFTPGHTDGCTCLYGDKVVFTGDTLLYRGCGRTDFQNGHAETLYKSIQDKLYSLPDDTKVYPGHNYHGLSWSTIGEEKKFNPRITALQTLDGFKEIMANLHLDLPKMIDKALPANKRGGPSARKKVGP